MAALNKVLLIGNLTRDPELKFMPNQTAVCDFGMAVNRSWTGADGQKKEEVTFIDVTSFGKQAEVIAQWMKKGRPIFIEGRLKLDQWEKDGTKHYKMKVIAEGFQFIGPKADGEAGDGPARPAARAPVAAPRSAYGARTADAGYSGEEVSATKEDDKDLPF